ncbi:MAG: class I tRNA ligase family protein, partial [Desulfuromonas sp.]
MTRLAAVEIEANTALEEYRFNEAANILYAFTWHEFCDWYIELIKGALYGDDVGARYSAQATLYTVLERLLRLLHPITPFITEEIWQKIPGNRPVPSIMLSSYPQGDGLFIDPEGSATMEQVMEVIRAIRNIRGEMDVPPGRKISAVLACKDQASCTVMDAAADYIKALARVEDLTCGVGMEQPAQVAKQVAGDVEILLPLAGLIDVDEEEKRLDKEIAKAKIDVDMFSKKLANEKFVANAPAQVLEKDRAKLAAAQEKMQVLQASLEKIVALK